MASSVSFPSGPPIILILFCFVLFPSSLRLSSCFLIFFSEAVLIGLKYHTLKVVRYYVYLLYVVINNTRIIGVPEGKETEEGIENLFQEIKTESLLEIEKKKTTQIQEAHRVPRRMNPKRPKPRDIIIKLANTNNKVTILKAARERQKVTYKGTPSD